MTFGTAWAIIKIRRMPAQTSIPRSGTPDGCHNIQLMSVRIKASEDHEPFWCEQTAHFFLSYRYSTRDTMLAMEPKAPRTAKIVEVICIASFGKVSRKSSTHASIPLSRDAGNRRLPYTVCKMRRGRWDLTGTIIQETTEMLIGSQKIRESPGPIPHGTARGF